MFVSHSRYLNRLSLSRLSWRRRLPLLSSTLLSWSICPEHVPVLDGSSSTCFGQHHKTMSDDLKKQQCQNVDGNLAEVESSRTSASCYVVCQVSPPELCVPYTSVAHQKQKTHCVTHARGRGGFLPYAVELVETQSCFCLFLVLCLAQGHTGDVQRWHANA